MDEQKNNPPPAKNSSGISGIAHPGPKTAFSIIEVVAAIAILALISAGMLAIFEQGGRSAKKTKEPSAAYNLARAILEQYADWGFIPANGTYTLAVTTINGIPHTPSLSISDGPCVSGMPLCPPNNELKQLSLTISWPKDIVTGLPLDTVTVSTLKANY